MASMQVILALLSVVCPANALQYSKNSGVIDIGTGFECYSASIKENGAVYSAQFPASAVLDPTWQGGSHNNEQTWLTPNHQNSWFTLEVDNQGPVAEFHYLNTCNTPYNDRSTTGYKIEVSEDNVNWEDAAEGSLTACADIQGDPKVIQNGGPHEGIKYVKFTTTSYKSNGGGMNYFAACGPPTPAPPTPEPPTPPPTVCGVSHPVSPYGKCAAWGDPHYTATFTKGAFDFMGFGVYKMGRSVDGCFEVQAYQCQVGTGSPSTYAGFAIKAGSRVVQIVDSQVYVDGEEVSTDSYPADISMQGSPAGHNFEMSLCDCGNTTGTVGYFFAKHNANSHYGINGYLDMSFELNNAVLASDGVCASDAASAQITCNANGKLNSLFTKSQISTLNAACRLEDCPPPPLPPKTPEEECEAMGIDHATAAAKCNAKGAAADQLESCILDYCASGGSDDFPEPPHTPAPPFTSMPTPPPTPPTPVPPTPAPTHPCLDGYICTPGDKVIKSFCHGTYDIAKIEREITTPAECKAECDANPKCVQFVIFRGSPSGMNCRLSSKCLMPYTHANPNIDGYLKIV